MFGVSCILNMELKTLHDRLTEWTDWDQAGFILAQSIGLMSLDVDFFTAKHIFWTNNFVGSALHNVLKELVTAGVLQNRDEPDAQYRWNPTFVGSWVSNPDGKNAC
jgi:hypothetical protein